MKSIVVAIGCAVASLSMFGQTVSQHPGGASAGHQRLGIVSDWSHRHVIYSAAKDASVRTRIQKDPRWTQNWYLRHPEEWWPGLRHQRLKSFKNIQRDWNVDLGPGEGSKIPTFQPMFDYSFAIGGETGNGTLNTFDNLNNTYLATAGSLAVTNSPTLGDTGTYLLDPTYATNPGNLLYPNQTPLLDGDGLEFTGSGNTIVISYTGGAYQYVDNGSPLIGGSFSLYADPDQGQTSPAKYVFDVTAAPSCSGDYVAIGIPANAVWLPGKHRGLQRSLRRIRYQPAFAECGRP